MTIENAMDGPECGYCGETTKLAVYGDEVTGEGDEVAPICHNPDCEEGRGILGPFVPIDEAADYDWDDEVAE